MRFDINYYLQHCFQHYLFYVHAHNYMNTTQYKLSLFDSMTWFTSHNQFKLNAKNHKEMLFNDNKHFLLEICQIEIKSFCMLAWKQDHKIFAVIMKDIEKVLNLKSYVDSWLFVSEKYYDLINMFEKKETDKLASYHYYYYYYFYALSL